jgi:hypothetical protein
MWQIPPLDQYFVVIYLVPENAVIDDIRLGFGVWTFLHYRKRALVPSLFRGLLKWRGNFVYLIYKIKKFGALPQITSARILRI